MAIQTIDRGTSGDTGDKFKPGVAFDTCQANDDYLELNKVGTVATFADLASTPATVGQIVKFASHTSGGVGGGDAEAYSATHTTTDYGMNINSVTVGVRFRRINYTRITVEMFGGIGNGVADDFAAVTRAIAYCATINGGEIYFPPRTTPWNISGEIVIQNSNISLVGSGPTRNHDAGSPKFGTQLKCTGGGVPLVTFKSPAGGSCQTGGGVRNMDLWCNGLATYGLLVRSWRAGVFEDIFAPDATVASFQLDAYSSGYLLEASDVQHCRFTRLTWRNIDSAAVQSAHGIVLSGDATPPTASTANASFNIFESCAGQCYNGINFLLQDADNNIFIQCRAFRLNGTATSGLEIRAPAEANHFISFSSSGANGIRIKGIASGYYGDPVKNSFYAIDGNNGTLYPNLDADCLVSFHLDGGYWQKQRLAVAVLSENAAVLNAESLLVGNESMRIRNGSGNHVVLTDGTNKWGVNIDGSGNFRFTKTAGSGYLDLGQTEVRIATHILASGTTAPASGSYLVGARCWNSAPAVGSPKGWICTVAGTPGTWVSEGNL